MAASCAFYILDVRFKLKLRGVQKCGANGKRPARVGSGLGEATYPAEREGRALPALLSRN
eukprot:1916202-Pleurochrysis_carterae.AAC.1